MERIRRLIKLIADLDSQARAEIAAAAAEGEFEEISLLTPLAKEIAELAIKSDHARQPMAAINLQNTLHDASTPEALSGNAPLQQRRGLHKDGYPQFVRERSDLIKIGRSPQEKGLYEHRVPKTVVDVVCRGLVVLGKTGHRFRMDALIEEASKSNDGDTRPSYQVYAVVSWLKWAGMIVQHGRQGYTVVRPQSLNTAIDAAWLALPQR